MNRLAVSAVLVVGLLVSLAAPLAFAQPTFTFDQPCLVEGGIKLTFTASEDIAAGRLQWLLSDGQQIPVGAVAANTPQPETTSAGGTSILLLDGDEVGRVFAELDHIQDCERPVVLRLAGPTRFDTSVVISQWRFQGRADTVYLATGGNFADALAGTPLVFDGPILLVERDVLPDVVRDEITRLEPDHIVVFGGTAAVSESVLQAARDAAGLS